MNPETKKTSLLLWWSLLFTALMAFFHFSAGKYSLYWAFPWFDMLVHFTGGLWLGVISAYLYLSWSRITGRAASRIGVVWEIFEYVNDITYTTNYVTDTMSDLFLDVIGAFCSLYFIGRFYFLPRHEKV